MHIYDYLFAGVIIIALLLGSTVMMAMLSTPALNASDKDLLKIASEKIATQMLLDPGYPYNWGSDNTPQQNMTVFGLARYGQTSRDAYLLDPDKVLRLNSTLEGSASYYFPASAASSLPEFENYTALSLLNLGKDYGFTLEFNETLKVSVNQMGPTDIYSISVASDYALPMMGANVSATLYYVSSSSLLIDHLGPEYNATIYDGSCILDLSGSSTGEAKVLAVGVDYYGVHTAKLYGSVGTYVLNATLFGSTLIPSSSQPYNITNGADSREITLIQTNMGHETKDFEVENSGTPTNFTLNSAPEPSTVAILAVSGNKLLVGSRDFSMISYRTIPAIRSAASAYSLERTVLFLEDVLMTGPKPKTRANSGFARILETVVAATIIFIVFTASSFFINSSQVKAVQERTDLDRLGYNVLGRLTESGTIEATIENGLTVQLNGYLQHSLPLSIFFNLAIMNRTSNPDGWVNLPSLSNSDYSSFSNSLEVSSTPLIYTSKNGNIYYLVLVLANAGEGT
jgi:hypothetical protein